MHAATRALRLISITFILLALIAGWTGNQGQAHSPVTYTRESQQADGSPFQLQSYPLKLAPPAALSEIKIPEASWLRLRFDQWELGPDSYLLITAHEDGSRQRLDAGTLPLWHNTSAYFNGSAVTLELHAAPTDPQAFIHLNEILIGTPDGITNWPIVATPLPASICGTTDERTRSNDRAIGRITDANPVTSRWAFCTGWIIANGAHLTAGHCADPLSDFGILEFNVPASDADGSVNFAAADDQYPIDSSSATFHNNGRGDDWAVFGVYTNSNTGLYPVQAQEAFYRLAMPADADPQSLRTTGFGVDGPAPCFGDRNLAGCSTAAQNSDNKVQQSNAGNYLGETGSPNDIYIEYQVDTQPAGSGSPVLSRTTTVSMAVAIHTTGGCTGTYGNSGTSFAHTTLSTTIATFPAPIVTYVDQRHPLTPVVQSGSIFRPWANINLGVYFAPNGTLLSIVKGDYSELITITKAVTLTAPVGLVSIGK